MLGFVALVPWLRALDAERTLRGTLLDAWAMSVAYTAAGFAWLGVAIGSYTQVGTPAGIAVLLLAAPLFQPQVLAFALVRHLAGRRHGRGLQALAAAAAWLATEALVPRLLGDSFGHGLYPTALLRQAADVGGVAGLTLLLLLANEALAAALARRHAGAPAMAVPLALAAVVPLLLAGYGAVVLAASPAPGTPLRMGLVQSNIVDYERLRREKGAAAVVREVLDTHYAMSYDAVERHRAQAMLWSETVYPTTFGRPKSEAGAELDREILEVMRAAAVPFVFGTYDRDARGEYNAAAFVAPGTGLLGSYRKARPFPLTEYVPPWLDGPALRRWLPWAGSWQPGDGARVFPLRLKDGREIPVLPLICLDDVDAGLAIAGARLGAQAILTLSNDAWFTQAPQGARLHLAAAAFRSIETRLPQYRVTNNGQSALIDATGAVIAGTRMGEQTLVIGELPVGEVAPTRMVAWGDWVGQAAAVFLVVLAGIATARRWWPAGAAGAAGAAAGTAWPARLAVLPAWARIAAGTLRVIARGGLLAMAAAVVLGHPLAQSNTFAQLRAFTAFFLAPEIAAWCVLRAFTAQGRIEAGWLVFTRGRQRLALAVREVAAVQPWRIPLPAPGAWLRTADGGRWRWGLAGADAHALAGALSAAGAASLPLPAPSPWLAYTHARAAVPPSRLDHPLAKFVLLPLLLSIPAFRLHQHIAFGSAFGELQAFGLLAYLRGFALWWAAWAMGVVLFAGVVRALVEGAAVATVLLRPAVAGNVRVVLERLGRAVLYLGLPAWLTLRLLVP